MTDFNPQVVENYLANHKEILEWVTQNDNLFTRRVEGTKRAHRAKPGGPTSKFSSIFNDDMPQEFKDMVLKTIPDDRKWLSQIVINKYEPGDYLVKHTDAAGGYYKFKLIWLTDGTPHFCWYDADDNRHLIQEKKGAMFKMDIGLCHAVTEIGPNEPAKYSLCLIYR